MFKPVKAKTVDAYIRMLDSERKADIQFLHKLIQKILPKLNAHFAYNMLGYGSFKYKNYKKDVIDWPMVALASQKNYISCYVGSLEGKQYHAEKDKDKLGKVSVGKSCIRFKTVKDLNIGELTKILKKAAKSPMTNV